MRNAREPVKIQEDTQILRYKSPKLLDSYLSNLISDVVIAGKAR